MTTPFKHQIISAKSGTRVTSWQICNKNLLLSTGVAWSIRKFVLHGGKQEGVDAIEVNNGRLRFVVIPTRGMGLLNVEAGDVRLGWNSPVKEVVHPRHINLESRGGLGWLDGFNEWLARCGLEWAGHPGPDRFRDDAGNEVEMNLTLHGKIANIPASEVEVVIEDGPRPRLHVRGLVQESMFHGPQLGLWTDISTELGSDRFRIEDSVTNHGVGDQEFQIIYHANFGPPLLGAGSRFEVATSRVTPFNAHAARDVTRFNEYGGPQTGAAEQVYCLHPIAGADGRTETLLRNAAADRGVSLEYSVAELPFLTLWKNLASEGEGYVTGIEPGTGFPSNRNVERKAGRVPKLGPKQTRKFVLDVAIQRDAIGVAAASERVRKLQGSTQPKLDS